MNDDVNLTALFVRFLSTSWALFLHRYAIASLPAMRSLGRHHGLQSIEFPADERG
jgi:hypothetical protein